MSNAPKKVSVASVGKDTKALLEGYGSSEKGVDDEGTVTDDDAEDFQKFMDMSYWSKVLATKRKIKALRK